MNYGASMQHETLKASSIRKPWAEPILRGDRAVEFCSQITKTNGQVYINASLAESQRLEASLNSDNQPQPVGFNSFDVSISKS